MRRNSAGLWEEVANNVPRLQYPVGGGCPSWLFEPQATNLFNASQVDDNINWISVGSSKVFNSIQSPRSGFLATKLVEDTANSEHIMLALNTGGSNATHTVSFYAKTNGRNISVLNNGGGTSLICNFDLTAGTGSGSGFVSITNEGNGWWFCVCQYNPSISTYNIQLRLLDGTTASYLGDGVSGAYVWGTQFELGSVATSPIITSGSAVTRLDDVANKTGISSLIGQTEGTLYIDLIGTYDRQTTSKTAVALTGGAANVRLDFYAGSFNLIALGIDVGAAFTSGQQYKVALVYANTSLKWFINGALYNSYTVTPSTFSAISLGSIASVNQPNTTIKDCILYTTALTDSEAIELTTL
jgi:hypothetical protein